MPHSRHEAHKEYHLPMHDHAPATNHRMQMTGQSVHNVPITRYIVIATLKSNFPGSIETLARKWNRPFDGMHVAAPAWRWSSSIVEGSALQVEGKH